MVWCRIQAMTAEAWGGTTANVIVGRRGEANVTRLAADGSLVEVRTRRGGDEARVATLFNVEALQFRDRVERTARPVRTLWWKFLGYEFTPAQAGGPTSRGANGLVRRPVRG